MEDISEDESDNFLEIGNVDTKAWLVKIPKFLAEQWNAIEEPGVELGVIRIYKDQVKDSSGKFTSKVSLQVPELRKSEEEIPIPKNYNLTITNMTPHNQFVFTESNQGRAVEVVRFNQLSAKIEHEAVVGPVVDNDYRAIMQMRTKLASAANSSRVVKVMNEKNLKNRRLVATAGNQWDASSKFLRKKNVFQKRDRMERKDLLDLIFYCFEENETCNLKQLQDKTNQPSTFLKEVLSDVCILNKRGASTGMYQLKPEFVQNKPSSSSPIL